MTEIFKAGSVEEAKALAVKKFGKDKQIRFEIVEEGKKGLFGLGKKEAVVKATVADGNAPTKVAAASKPVTEVKAPVRSEAAVKSEEVKQEAKNAVSEAEKIVSEVTPAEKKPAAVAEVKPAEVSAAIEENADEQEFSLDNFTLIEDESQVHPKVKLARDYITSILRAIGASKHDVSTVFNAETLLVGLTAGIIGILVSVLLTIPINLIIHSVTSLDTLRAHVPVTGAVVLILISMFLTFIAGLIPSRLAAKKDPVVALRTE